MKNPNLFHDFEYAKRENKSGRFFVWFLSSEKERKKSETGGEIMKRINQALRSGVRMEYDWTRFVEHKKSLFSLIELIINKFIIHLSRYRMHDPTFFVYQGLDPGARFH